jgi:hypothetical protein
MIPSRNKAPGFVESDGGRAADGFAEHNDCTVRALALLSGKPYVEAHRACSCAGRKSRRRFKGFSKRVGPIARELGVSLRLVKRSGTLHKLLEQFPESDLLVSVRGHVFALKKGVVHDLTPQAPRRLVRHAWLLDQPPACEANEPVQDP